MTQDELLATLPSVFMGLPLKHKVSFGLDVVGQVKWSCFSPSQTPCGTFEVKVSAAPFVASYLFEKRPVFSVEADSIEEVELRMSEKLSLFAEKTQILARGASK